MFTEGCGFNEPELLDVGEGISPGYGDSYLPQLEGQYIDITGVAAGPTTWSTRSTPTRSIKEIQLHEQLASLLIEID